MKSKYIILILSFILLFFVNLTAENIRVRIFTGINISDVKVEPYTGRYIIKADNEEFLLSPEHHAEISTRNSKIQIKLNGKDKGNFKNIQFKAENPENILKLTPNRNSSLKREYEGDFIFKSINNSIQIINDADIEHYLAGVIQGEIYGKPDQIDIFKVQAVISRTWVLKNMEKHKNDGYNVCDAVHCQVYKNRCLKTEILQATEETHNEVMIDANGNLIETAFHSNSGGQTVNSEDVWQSALPYLRSVTDTFSTCMKMATWEKKISKNEWLDYFKNKHRLNTRDRGIKDELLNFKQESRQTKICNVSLRTIREDFKLRSTYFNVVENGNEVILSGKGFGHGVGLSQEGAIRMVELGIPYDNILTFYYTGTQLRKPEKIVNTLIADENVNSVEFNDTATETVSSEIINVLPPTAENETIAVEQEIKSDKDKKEKTSRREKKTSRREVKKERRPKQTFEDDCDFEIILD